ncbi:MAG: transglutaminase domain-containing protein [Solirubrobacterales bacterium]|nr:transglutaminase domain-containing protein [Solirubrobacterales bacterium]
MSAGANRATAPRAVLRAPAPEQAGYGEGYRTFIRLLGFAALGAYGAIRWATLMRNPPAGRLAALVLLAIVLGGLVPILRRRGPGLAAATGALLVLAAVPVSGVSWHWVVHLRVADIADRIAAGLTLLPDVLVPYLGTDHGVRLVIVLGAAALLLAAGAALACAPPGSGDGWRAAAALPLLGLAVVPSTLVRPTSATFQGLILFALLAFFAWGERLRDGALGALVAAGIAGALLAPQLDSHHPWVDYRAWTGTPVAHQIEQFHWNQTYGPLRWPRQGRQVLTVRARAGDYWKAEDLTEFDGREWIAAPDGTSTPLPAPDPALQRRFTQKVDVTITGMRTFDVIGAGDSAVLGGLQDVQPGADAGTWVSPRALTPGTSYEVASYSPQPTPARLRAAGDDYPDAATAPYRTLTIPQRLSRRAVQIEFPRFHRPGSEGRSHAAVRRFIATSPYARAVALAQRLAARARTPYDFVMSVRDWLAHGYRYDETPPRAAYPLETFLFDRKLGYCQQFSGAMGLLLRMGGIPARVASGFTTGTPGRAAHTWTVQDTDAHAWVEAWFPHDGWVRFDPTPATAPARSAGALSPILPSQALASGGLAAGHQRADEATRGGVATTVHHRRPGGTRAWLLVPAAAGLLLLGLVARALLSPARGTDQLLAELRRAMALMGRPLSDEVTLASLERRFADAPAAAGYVRALRLARYGTGGAPPTGTQRRALRRELAFGLGPLGRLWALWALPPRLRSAASLAEPDPGPPQP